MRKVGTVLLTIIMFFSLCSCASQRKEYDLDNLENQYGVPLSEFIDGELTIKSFDYEGDTLLGGIRHFSCDAIITVFPKRKAEFKNACITSSVWRTDIDTHIDSATDNMGSSIDFTVNLDDEGNGVLPIHFEGSTLRTSGKDFRPSEAFKLYILPYQEGFDYYSGTIVVE